MRQELHSCAQVLSAFALLTRRALSRSDVTSQHIKMKFDNSRAGVHNLETTMCVVLTHCTLLRPSLFIDGLMHVSACIDPFAIGREIRRCATPLVCASVILHIIFDPGFRGVTLTKKISRFEQVVA
jgi:hypothetical protein